ncbi:uncharacterized protein METZ01_LOCUS278536, partial [marine metagenome]
MDVSSRDDCKKTAEIFLEKSGRIDTVIANAGVGGPDELFSGNAEAINQILS